MKYAALTSTAAIKAGSQQLIWAIGDTAEEAIAKAVNDAGTDHAAPADFEAEEITDRLAELVESGKADEWTERNGVLDIEVSDERLLYDLIDHVWDGMTDNARYNSESGLMADWQDADLAIETYITSEGLSDIEEDDTPSCVKMRAYLELLEEPHVKEIAAEVLERRMAKWDADKAAEEAEKDEEDE
ncbi:MAG: hypothetical protein CML24_09760 [Rhizobiales bacterium]|mgnify:CR=1 FL=1|nr:hypothetical protein [Hyphomicrobiales bacterium]|tara:strand:+ start:5553 stop:6113 length:561 start_codon:yes stop_codon:yes gene_type:complete